LTGYGKIIRNAEYFPDDCISDAERNSFLTCWFERLVSLSESAPGSYLGRWGRFQRNCLYWAGNKEFDGGGGAYIKVSPRHNYGIIEQGYIPNDVFKAAREFAVFNWKTASKKPKLKKKAT